MSDVSGALDKIASASAGIYLGAVIYQGNFFALMDTIKKDGGFLEFAVAAGALWGLSKVEFGQPVIGMLIVGGFLAVLIQFATHADIASKFKQYGDGKIGLFQLIQLLFKP